MNLAQTDKRFREVSEGPVVVVERNGIEQSYAVYVGGDADLPQYDREYIWGEFDDCTVSWQRARADAHKYAREVRAILERKKR